MNRLQIIKGNHLNGGLLSKHQYLPLGNWNTPCILRYVCLDPQILITPKPVHGTIQCGSLSCFAVVPPYLPIDVYPISPMTRFYSTTSPPFPHFQQLRIKMEGLIETILHCIYQSEHFSLVMFQHDQPWFYNTKD